ncbi:ATP-binding protein [Aquipuribacter sp. SD81]|uniref:ATP-binding protein n=1 Tax=Aquipuribacter sp. SD81 TaxID=3127703 RepID=UPI00301A8DB0
MASSAQAPAATVAAPDPSGTAEVPGADPTAATAPGTAAVSSMLARLAGVLVVLTVPAWGHGALDQRDFLAGWWQVLAVLGICVPAAWLVVLSLRRAGDIRAAAAWLSVGTLACLVLWEEGVTDEARAAQGLPWLWLVLPLTTLVLASLGSVPLSTGYGLVVGTAYAVVRVQPVGGGGTVVTAVLELVLIVGLSAGPAVLVVGARRAAARLDAVAARAAEESTAAARAAAALATRRELDAAVHDTVLAALHTAVHDPGAPELPSLAERALTTLSSVPDPAGDEPVSGEAVGRRLQESLAAVAPEADLDVRGGPAVPAVVARALTEAALEAARNARRHGGGAGGAPDITVEVRPSGDGRGLVVVVHDDGVGFDPALVAPHRMGLAVSVRARMARVGGEAELVTATGSGTTVRLSWRPGGEASP